jgi:hypothetical protein
MTGRQEQLDVVETREKDKDKEILTKLPIKFFNIITLIRVVGLYLV